MSQRFDRTGCVVSLIIAAWACPAAALGPGAGSSEKRVTAVGRAAGTDLKAKDEACMDAKRMAVLNACGESIGAASLVDNFELVRDQIISQANGYIVESREVKSGADEANGISFCEIEAVVATGKIKDRPPMMWTSPRIIPIVTEDFDGNGGAPPMLGGMTQAVFEGQLLKASLIPVDKATMTDVLAKEIKVEEIKGNAEALCAYVKKFDADIVIQFDLLLSPMGPVRLPPPADSDIYRFSPAIIYRVIQIDNAHVIDTDVVTSDDPLKSTSADLPPKDIIKFVNKEAPKIVKKIASEIQKRDINYKPVTVTFDGCSADEFRAIKQAILGLRGCQTVFTRQCAGTLVTTDILWAFSADRLAQKLIELPIKGFAIATSDQTGNSLKMTVSKTD